MCNNSMNVWRWWPSYLSELRPARMQVIAFISYHNSGDYRDYFLLFLDPDPSFLYLWILLTYFVLFEGEKLKFPFLFFWGRLPLKTKDELCHHVAARSSDRGKWWWSPPSSSSAAASLLRFLKDEDAYGDTISIHPAASHLSKLIVLCCFNLCSCFILKPPILFFSVESREIFPFPRLFFFSFRKRKAPAVPWPHLLFP